MSVTRSVRVGLWKKAYSRACEEYGEVRVMEYCEVGSLLDYDRSKDGAPWVRCTTGPRP